MTNLFDVGRFPASQFGDLYHQRWRIEEAFKRLKHRLNLEHVSGLSQQAVVQDVAAKVLCDNLQALTALTARDDAQLAVSARINHAYVFTALKPLLPALLLGKKVVKLLRNVLQLIAKQTYLHRENLSKPRKPGLFEVGTRPGSLSTCTTVSSMWTRQPSSKTSRIRLCSGCSTPALPMTQRAKV